jgi:DNA end-binding protein Ku
MRSMSSKHLSFGLVNVPVRLYSATSAKEIAFNQITPAGNRVQQKLVDAVTGKPVERTDLRRGFEYERGEFVVVDKAALEACNPEVEGIEISEFVAADEIDPMLYDKTYLIGPDKGGEKAYALLALTLAKAGRVGIAKVVLSSREHLVAIRPRGDFSLTMTTLFYADEVADIGELNLATSVPEKALLAEAMKLVAGRTVKFNPGSYSDSYRAAVTALLDREVAKAIKGRKAAKVPVQDIMASLKASVEAGKPSKGKAVAA